MYTYSHRKIDRNAGNLEIWTISIFRQPSRRHTFRHPPPLPPRGIESLHIPHLHPHGLALNDLAATSIVWPYQGPIFLKKSGKRLDDCGFLGFISFIDQSKQSSSKLSDVYLVTFSGVFCWWFRGFGCRNAAASPHLVLGIQGICRLPHGAIVADRHLKGAPAGPQPGSRKIQLGVLGASDS